MFERLLLSSVVLLSTAAGAWAGGPAAVSPGAEARFLGVASACPTFSWTAVPDAGGYELVVYGMPGDGGGALEVASPDLEAVPAIRATVPAGALSWTPPSESCLELSSAYAWSVRALGPAGVSEWSDSKLFKVDTGAVVAGIADALERALGRYLDHRGIRFEGDGGLAALIVDELRETPAVPAADASFTTAPPVTRGNRVRYSRGRRLSPGEEVLQGVFVLDDAELTLVETDATGGDDYAQLALDVPSYTGSSAWNLAVVSVTGGPADGRLFLSGPTFTDVFIADPADSKLTVPLLELPDIVRLIPKTSGSRPLCTGAITDDEGRLYYDTSDGLCYCDGSSWKRVEDGTTAC